MLFWRLNKPKSPHNRSLSTRFATLTDSKQPLAMSVNNFNKELLHSAVYCFSRNWYFKPNLYFLCWGKVQKLDCSLRAYGFFTLICEKTPPAARDSSEVARALNRRCDPHIGNGGHSLGFEQEPILVGRVFYPGWSHGCWPVRATGVALPCGRYLLVPLTLNKQGSSGLMVLRVKPTPTRFPTNSLNTPMDNTPLHSLPSVWRSLALKVLRLHMHDDTNVILTGNGGPS